MRDLRCSLQMVKAFRPLAHEVQRAAPPDQDMKRKKKIK